MMHSNKTIFFLISGLLAASVVTACGGSGFQVKDVSKDLLRLKATTPADTTTPKGTLATGGTTATGKGTTAIAGTTSVATPVTPGTPAVPAKTTIAATETRAAGCPNEIYSECTTKVPITEDTKKQEHIPQPGDADFMGPLQPTKVVETKTDKDGTPTLTLKTGYDILFRDELHQVIIKNRKVETSAKGTEISFELELDQKTTIPLKVIHLAQKGVATNLATTKLPVYQTKNKDSVTVYVNSFCKVESDAQCASNILILDFMIENGKVDENMVAGMGVVISPKQAEPTYYSDSFMAVPESEAEQMGMDQFIEFLEKKL